MILCGNELCEHRKYFKQAILNCQGLKTNKMKRIGVRQGKSFGPIFLIE